MIISQIYTLEQQVQSTSYPHYVHLSCNVKLKGYSIFTFKKILLFFFGFLLKKDICYRTNINKLTNNRKRNLFHIKGLGFTKGTEIFKELNQFQQAKEAQIQIKPKKGLISQFKF